MRRDGAPKPDCSVCSWCHSRRRMDNVSERYPLSVSVATPFDKHHIAIRIDLTIEQLVDYPQRLVPAAKDRGPACT